MQIRNHPEEKRVAIIGMPRSGTTVLASFLNSIDGAMIWGEPHRSRGKPHAVKMPSRYGTVILHPEMEILPQLKSYASAYGLWMFGFKEVYDSIMRLDPINLVSSHGNALDWVFVSIRNPRKNWSSMLAIGHANMLGMDVTGFMRAYKRFIDFSRYVNFEGAYTGVTAPKVFPVVMEKFISNPVAYISSLIGYQIEGAPKLLRYTGGGDPHTIRMGTRIRKEDIRPAYLGADLAPLDVLYRQLL